MNFFSKLKDYNLELEEILDNKYFSSSIKNLLFNMIYKVETSYADFSDVKRCVRTKEEVLDEIIETIKLYCDNIKTVEPDSDQAKMLIRYNLTALTNARERSILTYPTELALLYAVSDISPKYFYVNPENVLKDTIQRSLVNGYNMNTVEILKDFNGWSWDISDVSQDNFIDNIIYQMLLIMLGENFICEWKNYNSISRDFLQEAKKYVKAFTANDKFFKALYKLLYLNLSDKDAINEQLKIKKQKLKKMEDKEKFIDDCKTRKLKLTKKIEKIDIALNDSEMLVKQFKKANLKLPANKQIKSIKAYTKLIKKEKENCLKEIDQISFILKPSNFLEEKKILQETVEVYNCKETIDVAIINLQKEFLYFLDKKLGKMKTRDEIIDIIYELRYYRKLKLAKNTFVTDIEEIDLYIDKVLKKAITMLCKIGGMKIISMDINLNFEIIKYALDTKIINLEEVKICIVVDDEGLIIKVFDKDVFEKQGRKKMEHFKNMLEIKPNRKIKIFN